MLEFLFYAVALALALFVGGAILNLVFVIVIGIVVGISSGICWIWERIKGEDNGNFRNQL